MCSAINTRSDGREPMPLRRDSRQSRVLGMSLYSLFLLIALISCKTSVDDNPAEAPPNTVHIGLLAALTGTNATTGRRIEAGVRLAIEEINEAGGVNGQQLALIMRDVRQGDPNHQSYVVRATQELVAANCVAIVGPATSRATLFAKDTLVAAQVPLISLGSSPAITTLDDDDLIYRTIASDANQGRILGNKIIGDGIHHIAIINVDDAYGSGLAQALANHYADLGGEVMATVAYPPSKTGDFDTEVAQLFNAGTPEAIAIIGFDLESAGIVQALDRLHLPSPPHLYGADSNHETTFLANAPPQLVLGMRGTAPLPPLHRPQYQQFLKKLTAILGYPPEQYPETMYDAVYLSALAMAKARVNTSAGVVAYLREVSRPDSADAHTINIGTAEFKKALALINADPGVDIDYSGASGEVDFDANGDVNTGNYVWWEVVQGSNGLEFENLEEISF